MWNLMKMALGFKIEPPFFSTDSEASEIIYNEMYNKIGLHNNNNIIIIIADRWWFGEGKDCLPGKRSEL